MTRTPSAWPSKRFEAGIEMAALVMEEALAVGHQVLEVANLRAVDGGIVDLVQHAGRDGEPDRTTGRVRRADRVLSALGPSWCDPRSAERTLDGVNDHDVYLERLDAQRRAAA